MVKYLYHIVFFLVRFSGIASVIRFLFARNKVSIVLYHNPTYSDFNRHLEYLSRKYNLISLTQLGDAIASGNMASIPKYAMVVTMDDGWKENYELMPLFIKYGFRPTIFLASHIVGTDRHYWWTHCPDKVVDDLKILPETQRLAILREKYGFERQKEYPGDRQALSFDEIGRMTEFVDFGMHTCYHPILPKCTDEEKRNEILPCREKVEEILGHTVSSFAYPNGDYDDDCIKILKEAKVKLARSIDAGWNTHLSDPYRLKVTGVSDNASLTKLIAELTGISMYIQYLVFGSFNGKKNVI